MGGFVRKHILREKKVRRQIEAVRRAPSGPTKAELTQMRLSASKRRGRKSTKLGMEDEDLNLSTKALLS